MTIDHDRFAEANQPPPTKTTETPETEASPEPRPVPNVEPESDDRGAAWRTSPDLLLSSGAQLDALGEMVGVMRIEPRRQR